MCPDDGYVAFYASELVSGYLEKSLLGGGAKASLFAVLLRDSSAEASALTMGRLAKITSRFLMDYGFSIGIVDVQPTPRLTEEKAKLLARGYLQCKDKTDAFNSGNLAPSPGCTMEQTLESEMNGLLSKIRDDAGEICKRELHHLNAPLTMARCGSKGSFINISQMIACVGQQSVGGKRMPNGFVHRALPHFPRHSLEPAGVCISRRLHLPRMTSLIASECVGLPL
jgi:DNA-directed RNA polymerase III subunit RPC1